MMVFEDNWVKELGQKYDYREKYTAPFIAKLAFDPLYRFEKDTIEQLFSKLPDAAKSEILGRLRSTDRHQHFSAYFEMVLYEFLDTLGFSVGFHPRIAEGEPDLSIKGRNLTRPTVIEVITVFDEPQWEREEQKFGIILEKLATIEHYYSLIISNESRQIPEDVNYEKLKKFLQSQLDRFHSEAISNPPEFEYKEGGLELKLTALPNFSKSSIVLSHGGPARWVGTDQLRSAVEQKIKKYKSVKRLGLGFMVALNLANVPAGEQGLLNMLFGDIVVRIRRNSKGETVDVKEGRNFRGLFTPKPRLGGKALNTRLSAVMNIVSKWSEQKTDEPVRREHHFRIIHNPWAINPLGTEVFRGYPQFTVVSKDNKSIQLDWIDNIPD